METVRQQMIALLSQAEYSARDLSQLLKIREKEVYDHLPHVRNSLTARKKKLVVTPARCLECGYLFETRYRVSRPGRCPKCKGEHIQDPTYRIA